jgi:hypothetical protein
MPSCNGKTGYTPFEALHRIPPPLNLELHHCITVNDRIEYPHSIVATHPTQIYNCTT